MCGMLAKGTDTLHDGKQSLQGLEFKGKPSQKRME